MAGWFWRYCRHSRLPFIPHRQRVLDAGGTAQHASRHLHARSWQHVEPTLGSSQLWLPLCTQPWL